MRWTWLADCVVAPKKQSSVIWLYFIVVNPVGSCAESDNYSISVKYTTSVVTSWIDLVSHSHIYKIMVQWDMACTKAVKRRWWHQKSPWTTTEYWPFPFMAWIMWTIYLVHGYHCQRMSFTITTRQHSISHRRGLVCWSLTSPWSQYRTYRDNANPRN